MYIVLTMHQEAEVVILVGVILRFLMYVKNCEGNSASNASTTETSPSTHKHTHTQNHHLTKNAQCFS